MRVIAGRAKGCILKTPNRIKTRPATELVRGAIFSILEARASDWSRVLDLFSGSGALGIEALSRGANWVDFVEHEPRCCDIIRENLKKSRFGDKARVYCCSVAKAISFLLKEYHIILMDPPYSNPTIDKIILKLADSRLIGEETILAVTHSPQRSLNSSYAALELIKEHRHGDSIIAFYGKEVKL
jgi:16S rRNA (guanine(966)-N(2))-methyltransferase RsmD